MAGANGSGNKCSSAVALAASAQQEGNSHRDFSAATGSGAHGRHYWQYYSSNKYSSTVVHTALTVQWQAVPVIAA
jgi:hypothetical protein